MKSSSFAPIVFTVFCVACIPFFAHAGSVVPPTAAPFDGGLSLLIAAGVGYASKKAYDKRKAEKNNNDL